MIRKRGAEISGGKKEQTTWEKITVQFEEINQKVQVKEGRLKRYRQMVKQYRQNRTFQNNERKFYQQLGGGERKHTKNRMQKKPNHFGRKYGNQRNITKILNGYTILQEN